MKKMVFGKKFSRDTTSRRAMYRALVRSFVVNGVLTTTHSKASVIVPILERLFNRASKNTLSDRRFVLSFLGNDKEVTGKIFEYTKAMFGKKNCFFKYINLPPRKGDMAPMARVEFVSKPEKTESKNAEVMVKKSVVKEKVVVKKSAKQKK